MYFVHPIVEFFKNFFNIASYNLFEIIIASVHENKCININILLYYFTFLLVIMKPRLHYVHEKYHKYNSNLNFLNNLSINANELKLIYVYMTIIYKLYRVSVMLLNWYKTYYSVWNEI